MSKLSFWGLKSSSFLICFFIFSFLFTSCGVRKEQLSTSGAFKVLIPFNVSSNSDFSVRSSSDEVNSEINTETNTLTQSVSSTYVFKPVVIKDIENINQMKGSAAQFFIQPGVVNGQISGETPQVLFHQNKQGVLLAQDYITMQMFSLYYLVQEIKTFVKSLNFANSDQLNLLNKPMKFGLLTQVLENSSKNSNANKKSQISYEKNNAFFDGQTESILVLPYTDSGLSLAFNQGVMAHEYFHSLFYSIVLKPIRMQSKKNLSLQSVHESSKSHIITQLNQLEIVDAKIAARDSDADYFNETYLRGINEGLADYFAWVYTHDETFMNSSLASKYIVNRDLGLNSKLMILKDSEILNEVKSAKLRSQRKSTTVSSELSGYIYNVGTPFAILLKNLTLKYKNENNLKLTEAQKIIFHQVLKNLVQVREHYLALQESEMISTQLFLEGFVQDLNLQQNSCDLILEHLKIQNDKYTQHECVKNNGQVKPTVKENK